MTIVPDKRALKILMDSFWSPHGWKPEDQRRTSPDDFSYAKSKGMMFDSEPLDHEHALRDLRESISRLNRQVVADAFLASLSTRRLEWRSALGSYTVFQHMHLHVPAGSVDRCEICGLYLNQTEQDLSAMNFERYKWGGVRHDQVGYAALDLKLFLSMGTPKPVKEDIRIFHSIVSAISTASAEVTSATLQEHFGKLLKSNKAERDVIIAILGFCGILETLGHPGFSDSFIPVNKRTLPNRRYIDMPYPACWWEGRVGVNSVKLNEYFGHAL
jgi:hypothetical protein